MKAEANRKLLTALVILSLALVVVALVFSAQSPPRVELTFLGYTNQVPSGLASGTVQSLALFKMENKSDRLVGVEAVQLEVRTKQGWQDAGAPVVHGGMGLVSIPPAPTTLGWPEPSSTGGWRIRLTLKAHCGIGHNPFRSKVIELLRNQGINGLADRLYYPTWSLRSPEVIHSSLGQKSSS